MPEGHRKVELQSIALHRLAAERLDEPLLARARTRVERWLASDAPLPRRAAARWQQLLALPVPELRVRLVEDSEEMRDLRQCSPFAGALSQQERLRALASVGNRPRWLSAEELREQLAERAADPELRDDLDETVAEFADGDPDLPEVEGS